MGGGGGGADNKVQQIQDVIVAKNNQCTQYHTCSLGEWTVLCQKCHSVQ